MMSSLPNELLQLLGYAFLEDRGSGRFCLLGNPPPWFQEIWGSEIAVGEVPALADRSPFLEAFLSEAADYWNSDTVTPLESGAWIEQTVEGRDVPLEARAWRVGGKRILSIHSRQEEFQERTRVLQTARDSLLVHERLLKEIQKKEILLHCIIHDLSQPLTAIRGCLDVLAQETTAPASKRLIEVGLQQSQRQDTMIREVLQAFAADMDSAMNAGDAAQRGASLLVCADESVAAFGPSFRSHGAEIRLDPRVDRHARWDVVAEKSRLMRVFSNLIENALRHAPKGSAVIIGFKEDVGHVKAFVDDEGPGLPKEFKPSEAFALFSKGKQGGGKAGLGLYFCRITVERWGGTIGCESLPHRGARFWFRLPNAATSDASNSPATTSPFPASSPSAQADSPDVEPLNILLAEDDPAIRELTGVLLERLGHTITAVSSGFKAMRLLAKRQFDLVILDEEMPGMTGVEVTEAIRASESPGGKRQTVFALTGNATEDDRVRLLAAGFDACLLKPFRADELAGTLKRFALGAAKPPKDRGMPPSVTVATADALLARVGGDAKLLRSIASTFLKDYPATFRKIKQAITRKDAPALASAAHALKGAVAIFGADDAVANAANLQQMGRKGSLKGAASTLESLDEALARLDAKLREYAAPGTGNSSTFRGSRHAVRKPHRRAKRSPNR